MTQDMQGTLNTREVRRIIHEKFRIKRHDNMPYSGWLKSNRGHVVELFAALGLKVGVEVGVAVGRHARQMLDGIPNLKLSCVDPWQKYGNWTQEKMDIRHGQACAALKPYNNVTIIRKTSMEAVKDFEDESLDFVYIDGFHDFDYVMMDLIEWSKKVRKSGLVSGHDYYPFYRGGVVTAVDAFIKGHNITEWYVTKERESEWFWIKDYIR